MALTAKLEFRQSQSLVMTPQLMQAIKLLQMSHLDLASYVDAELERNPLLDRDEGGDTAEAAEGPGPAAEPVAEEADWVDTAMRSTGGDIEAAFDTSLDNVFPDEAPATPLDPGLLLGSSWAGAGSGGGSGSGEHPDFEASYAADISLAEHLSGQLALAVDDPAMRLVGRYLIDCLDEAGYLRADLDEIADRLGAPSAMVEDTLKLLQEFDPPGIFARDVKECLALQLIERDRFDPAMQALVDNLDLVARRDFQRLRRLCGVDHEDLVEMLEEIRALNPKPGNAFGAVAVQSVVPDVIVRPAPDGGWHLELNSETLPRVLVNHAYYARLPKAGWAEEEREFVADCLQTANWLVKSLDQRARTILRVAGEIVRQQDAFFARGVEFLRPLNLKAVAEAIEMHESTVSRVTSNKYIATPRGIFELKYFFTAAIAATAGGDAHSAESVRYRIKQLIDDEDADSVLSDDALVRILQQGGIDIARRTVAKYREAMGIASSVRRRREKQAGIGV